ncbi:DUF4405 domain-containing protein [Oceanobacillus picturae]|uniref:DUF4405 domain-containing protein n=1 Tax=Oceanobacillus picturae TaxID=171693 RepID=UPI00362FFB71
MNQKMLIKLTNDLVMTILMLVAMAYYITGNRIHEIVGLVILVLFIVHNFLNRRWYQSLRKGRYSLRRFLQIAVNLLFLVAMVIMVISGILVSFNIFPIIPVFNDTILREIHVLSAYWGFILMAIHIGFSWGIIINAMRRMSGIDGTNRTRTIILRLIAILIVVYGVQASFERDMFYKLTVYNPFGWDFDTTALDLTIDYLAMMGIYIGGTHYVLKFIQSHGKARLKKSN